MNEHVEDLRAQVLGGGVGEGVMQVAEHPRRPEEVVDGRVESCRRGPVVASSQLRVQGAEVEEDARFLERHRSLAARGACQRVIPAKQDRGVYKYSLKIIFINQNTPYFTNGSLFTCYARLTATNLPLEVNAKRAVRGKESSVDEIELIEVFEEKAHSRIVSLRGSHSLERKEM